jgi:hypothetical protein
MAVNEWLNGDSTITRFDDATNTVIILGPNYAPLEEPRPATQAEIDKNAELFPPRDMEPTTAGITRQDMITSLMSALGTMRSITADNTITADEINEAVTTVGPSLYMLRDYGQSDMEISYLVDLLLSQAVLALLTLINNARVGISGTGQAATSVRQDLQALRDEFEQYKAAHP